MIRNSVLEKKSRRKTFCTTRNRPESGSEVQLESQQERVTREAFAAVLCRVPRGRGLEELLRSCFQLCESSLASHSCFRET